MKATIHDVARLSGVSIGTVSRVLNQKPTVKAATRERVLQIVDQLGYVPESAARELSKGTSLTLGVHFPEGTYHLRPFSALFFQSVMRKVIGQGGKVIDLPSRSDGLPHTSVDGMILLGAHQGDPRIEFLESQGIPHVLVGHDIGRSWVAPNDVDGGVQVARYLWKCGHREFLFVTSRLDFQNNTDRLKGFRQELRRLGADLPDSRIVTGSDSSLDAYRSFSEFYRENTTVMNKVSAIFASCDEIAVGVLAALEDQGRRIPQDYSIVGFDDLPEIGKGLTTIHQSIPEIAEVAVELLRQQIDGEPPASRILSVQLIVRETSGQNLRA